MDERNGSNYFNGERPYEKTEAVYDPQEYYGNPEQTNQQYASQEYYGNPEQGNQQYVSQEYYVNPGQTNQQYVSQEYYGNSGQANRQYVSQEYYGEQGFPQTTAADEPSGRFCGNCGSPLEDGWNICPKCGNAIAPALVPVQAYPVNEAQPKKKKTKLILIIAAAAAVVIAAVVVVLVVILNSGPKVDSLDITTENVKLLVDKDVNVKYKISPSDFPSDKITWSSSDNDVATVNVDGKVTAVGEGKCTIEISAGDKTDSIDVTVKKGPDFKGAYNRYCDSEWATLAEDGSYLKLDTNPKDKSSDDMSLTEIYEFLERDENVEKVNEALGLPESLNEKFNKTRAIDGTQTETYDMIKVSWTYHPNQGLEVIYELNW